MNDESLPEDPNSWPTDPFALLGVKPGAAALEIRKAYTRLIRRFKPEQFPVQFRRLREAYENLLRIVAWQLVDLDHGHEDRLPAITVEQSAADRMAPPSSDTQADAWKDALAGRFEAGYRALVEIEKTCAVQQTLYIRLYWLLFLQPKLDELKSRVDWLSIGLQPGQTHQTFTVL